MLKSENITIRIRVKKEVLESTLFKRKITNIFIYFIYSKFEIKYNTLITNLSGTVSKFKCLIGLMGFDVWINTSSHLSEVLTS
jgi:hypothetical protein